MHHATHIIELARREPIRLGSKPVVMGILNVTPDSFSDGGRHNAIDLAVARASTMLEEGADIIDIGGESTRPGAEPVPVQEELDRVIPAIRALRAAGIAVPISIDTMKPLVADQALQAGADIVNDVRGLQGEPEMAEVAALYQAPVIAMHWDQRWSSESSPLPGVTDYLARSIAIAERAGLSGSKIVIDPGFGFGKSLEQNYRILRELTLLTREFPLNGILVGTSRKSMIGRVLGNQPEDRLAGTLATNVLGYSQGAHIFRVHDVRPNRDALRIAEATLYGPLEMGA